MTILLVFLTAFGGIAAQQVAQGQAASLTLLQRATDPNPALKSYTAAASLSATLRGPLPVRKTFPGTVYYLRPNRKIELQNVPGPLSRFKELAASAPSFEQLTAQYSVTPRTDDGTVSTYSLVPKNAGSRVKSVTVTVGDASAQVTQVEWLYTNGGKLSFNQQYSSVAGFELPSKANIAARFPGYSVDGVLTFSNYKPNAAVSPSVFVSPSPT